MEAAAVGCQQVEADGRRGSKGKLPLAGSASFSLASIGSIGGAIGNVSVLGRVLTLAGN